MYTITSKSFANYLCQWSLLERVNFNYNVFAIISKINLYLLCLYLKIKFIWKIIDWYAWNWIQISNQDNYKSYLMLKTWNFGSIIENFYFTSI